MCHLMINIKCVPSFVLMKIESLWNGLFEITGRQKRCLIFLGVFRFFTFSCLYGIFQKTLSKKYYFEYKFLKFILRSTILPSFTIWNLLLLKWQPFQYNTKFGKKVVFIDVFIRLLLKTLWKNYFFNTIF